MAEVPSHKSAVQKAIYSSIFIMTFQVKDPTKTCRINFNLSAWIQYY